MTDASTNTSQHKLAGASTPDNTGNMIQHSVRRDFEVDSVASARTRKPSLFVDVETPENFEGPGIWTKRVKVYLIPKPLMNFRSQYFTNCATVAGIWIT